MSNEPAVRTREEVFPCGDVALYRRAVEPDGAAWARLGILHGYGEHSGRYARFMGWMAERGVACRALDFRGHGLAKGRRGYVAAWDDYLADVAAFLACEADGAASGVPLFLLGHSHGGLVLAAWAIAAGGNQQAAAPAHVRGCILTAPYLRSNLSIPFYKRLAARMLDPIVPWLPIPNGLRDEWMSSDDTLVQESHGDQYLLRNATPRWYLSTLAAQDRILASAGDFRLPLLLLVGDADAVASPRAAHDFFLRAGSEDKTHRIYPDYLHELLRERGRETIFEHVLSWMRDRLPEPDQTDGTDPASSTGGRP